MPIKTPLIDKLNTKFKSYYFNEASEVGWVNVFRVGHNLMLFQIDTDLETVKSFDPYHGFYIGEIEDMTAMLELVMEHNAE